MVDKMNLRQIPSDKRYTAEKAYSDILYGYLQTISQVDDSGKEVVRFVEKKQVVFSRIAEELKMNRATVSKKFKYLIDSGLIVYREKQKIYELVSLDIQLAAYLPQRTVEVLCDTLKDRCLSILAYLFKLYAYQGYEEFEFNIDNLKQQVGLSVDNRSFNNEVVRNILLLLQQLGLISYHIEKKYEESSNGYRTRYFMEWMHSDVQFQEKVEWNE